MKIEKKKFDKDWFYHYYHDNGKKSHGLDVAPLWYGIGYQYHDVKKGIWLRSKKLL